MDEFKEEFHESWHPVIDVYYKKLMKALKKEKGVIVYPKRENIFKVFKMDVEKIKVVLLGQDPYHGPNQATGLAFSCNDEKIQPSLRNIFKELQNEFPERDYDFNSNNLSRWFEEEDIFLLNTALSVRQGEPGSNIDLWRDFTNAVIKYISDYNENCVFLLLGKPAQSKSVFIDDKSRIVSGVHPSPLSASKGFFNSGIFKRVEELVGEINWNTNI